MTLLAWIVLSRVIAEAMLLTNEEKITMAKRITTTVNRVFMY